MSCPQETMPAGWRVWRGAVPPDLTQRAIAIRNVVTRYQRGAFADIVTGTSGTVGFWVSSHTWTYRNGQLVTGICIPGVSLLVQNKLTAGEGVLPPDNLDVPDPNAAVFTVAPTDWGLVAAGGIAVAAIVAGFWWVLRGGR